MLKCVSFCLCVALLGGCRSAQDDALLHAARSGDLRGAETALAQGGKPSARDRERWTPLLWAASRGDAEMAALLLGRGADPDAASPGGVTALMLASLDGHAPLVRLLLERGARADLGDRNGSTALMAACHRGHWAAARELLACKADLNARDRRGRTALWIAVSGEYQDRLQSPSRPQRFYLAAREDQLRTVRALVEAGADASLKDSEGRSARDVAAGRKDAEALRILDPKST